MAYDYPYRLERISAMHGTVYEIARTGEGVICKGTNYDEMRKLVEAANEQAMQESGDRGR